MAETTKTNETIETTKTDVTPTTPTTHTAPNAEAVKGTKETKKTETKTKGKKEEKATPTPNKPAKKKGVKATWVKKEKVKKDSAAKKTQEGLQSKWKPVFWGRFGKKNLRTRNNAKYDKWRKPRGEDMQQKRDDGAVVDSGYRGPRAIRFIHPSGYSEVMIYSKKDLDMVKPTQAGRFASGIGRKKRIELIKYANAKKVYILN